MFNSKNTVENIFDNNFDTCKSIRKRLVIYQAPWNWDFLWNRAQPLAKSLSKYCTVVYLDCGLTESNKENPEIGEIIHIAENLYRYKSNVPKGLGNNPFYFATKDRDTSDYEHLKSQLKDILNSHEEIWLLTSRPSTVGILKLFTWDKIIVDIEDPWLSLSWGLQIKNTGLVESLLHQADVIFANGLAIANEYQKLANKLIHSLPNGVDSSFVNSLMQSQPCPKFFLESKAEKRAVFTGNINDRIDFNLLLDVVNKNYNFDFYFVGIQNIPRESLQTWLEIRLIFLPLNLLQSQREDLSGL